MVLLHYHCFLSDRWSVDYFEEETQELQSMLEKVGNKIKDAQDAPEDFKKKMDEFIEVWYNKRCVRDV